MAQRLEGSRPEDAMKHAVPDTSATKTLPNPPPENASVSEWAIWNALVGEITGAWKVFPCAPNQKKPLKSGWQQQASNDLKKIESTWLNHPSANIGLAIQRGFVAIDTDIYKPEAQAALEQFERENGRMPDTLETSTARGGFHLIYETKLQLGNRAGNLPKFGDVRGYGGLIVGPGSVFESKRYSIANLAIPLRLPTRLELLIGSRSKCSDSKSNDPVQFVVVDDPRNCEHFKNWCAGRAARTSATPDGQVALPCVEGQGGNNMLAATGALAKDYGLSADVALEIALEHFNPRCEPPWDDEEFEKHFRSGYKSATGKLGSRAPVHDYSKVFKPIVHSARSLKVSSRFQRYTVDQLNARVPPAWLLDSLIPQHGYTILYGPPGAFKTFLAISIALSVATGANWHGYKAQRGKVLYCMGEGSFDAHARISAWLNHQKTALPEMAFQVIEPAPMINLSGDAAEFIAEAARGGKWDLVVVDTIGRTMAGLNDNVQDGARSFTAFTAKMRNELGAATLAITHSPKEKPDILLGSGAYEADADVVLNATVAEKGKRVDLRQHKQKYLSPWKERMGFRALTVGKSIVLESCEASQSHGVKARSISDLYASQFEVSLSKCAGNDGAARWADVSASMLGMNDVTEVTAEKKVREQINNWFKNWPDRARYDSGKRGAHNAIILRPVRS